jgi:hypothetical protein
MMFCEDSTAVCRSFSIEVDRSDNTGTVKLNQLGIGASSLPEQKGMGIGECCAVRANKKEGELEGTRRRTICSCHDPSRCAWLGPACCKIAVLFQKYG